MSLTIFFAAQPRRAQPLHRLTVRSADERQYRLKKYRQCPLTVTFRIISASIVEAGRH
jgi:hypothetical protein